MGRKTVQELWAYYRDEIERNVERFRPVKSRWETHIIPHLGSHTDETLDRKAIDAWLHSLTNVHTGKQLAPSSANLVLQELQRIWDKAQADGLWDENRPNLARKVRPRRVPEPEPSSLNAQELASLLELGVLSVDWRGMVALAAYMGFRKVEVLRFRIADINWDEHLISCRKRKGFKRLIDFPIPEECMPYLWEARWRAETFPSEYLFCGPEGRMRSETTDAPGALRTALGRAGIVDGWQHWCAVPGCGYSDNTKSAAERTCPRHGRRLRVKPIPKDMVFHDLRATAKSLHTKAGCHPAVVDKMLSHAARDVGTKHYLDLDVDFCRNEVNKLSLKAVGVLRTQPETVVSASPASRHDTQAWSKAVTEQGYGTPKQGVSSQLLTYQQVADLLAVSVTTVRRNCRKWGLRPVKLNLSTRFVRSDVDALIARLREK